MNKKMIVLGLILGVMISTKSVAEDSTDSSLKFSTADIQSVQLSTFTPNYKFYVVAENVDSPIAVLYAVWDDEKIVGYQIEVRDPSRVLVTGDKNELAFR